MGTPETKAAAAVAAAVISQPPLPSSEKAGKPTTLLDMHEVEWITRELERLLDRESGAAGADARRHHHHHHHHRRKRAKVVSPVVDREPHPHAKKGGFLSELLGKHAASICCDNSAAAGAVVSVSGRRRRVRAGFREVRKV